MLTRRAFVAGSALLIAAPAFSLTDASARLTALANEARAREGRKALGAHPDLVQAAQSYAQLMGQTGEFSHRIGGKRLMTRVRATGYRPRYVSENIGAAQGYSDPDAYIEVIMRGWLKSPGHRKNLLSKKSREMGSGLATGADGTVYAVQIFARR